MAGVQDVLYSERVRTMAEEAWEKKTGLEVLREYMESLDKFNAMSDIFNKCETILNAKLEILDKLAGDLENVINDPLVESDKYKEFKGVMKAMKSVRKRMSKVTKDLENIFQVSEDGDKVTVLVEDGVEEPALPKTPRRVAWETLKEAKRDLLALEVVTVKTLRDVRVLADLCQEENRRWAMKLIVICPSKSGTLEEMESVAGGLGVNVRSFDRFGNLEKTLISSKTKTFFED